MIIHKKNIKSFLKITASATKSWWDKDPFMQSAVIAYYAIFSIPGLLVIVIAIGTLVFQRDVITGHVYKQISLIMGVDTAKQIQEIIITAGQTHKSVFATIIGLITVLIGATGVFAQLQNALNIIWAVKVKPRKAIFTLIRTRLFSFGLILSIGFLLQISLAITTILASLSDWIIIHWPDIILFAFYVLNFIVSFTIIMLLFSLMFKLLPDAKIKWKDVRLGSIITAFLFILGKTAIGFYLSKTNPGSAYGAAGSIVLILLWVSYSSMIFFYGAEFTHAYAEHFSGEVTATEIAVKTQS